MLLLRKITELLAPHDCLGCGREGSLLCLACLQRVPSSASDRSPPPLLVNLWVAADYQGLLKELLHRYKFDRCQDEAIVLAVLLDRVAPRLPAGAIVSFVPTATSRIRQRGYDHAALIARAFARRRGLVAKSLLIRHGQNQQVGSGRAERLRKAHVYEVRPGVSAVGRHIVLIDDVITTGSTLQAAARALVTAGAGWVDGLVVAQKE